jgi:excisionase family DNA binding protein
VSPRQAIQSRGAAFQEPSGSEHPVHGAGQRLSPYLTSREAVVYLRLKSLSSLYTHIRENRLPVLRAGGQLRFDMRELDAWLRGTTALALVRSQRKRV